MAGAWISARSATSLSRVPAYPFRLSTCAAASRIRSLVRADLELVSSGVATPSFLGTLQIIVPGTDGAGGRAGPSSCTLPLAQRGFLQTMTRCYQATDEFAGGQASGPPRTPPSTPEDSSRAGLPQGRRACR